MVGIVEDARLRVAQAEASGGPELRRRREELALLRDCVAICNGRSPDATVLGALRLRLKTLFAATPEINLFAMALTYHVAEPNDGALHECARWVFWDLLKARKEETCA